MKKVFTALVIYPDYGVYQALRENGALKANRTTSGWCSATTLQQHEHSTAS
jgi:hypothetical protein